ncbi:hypothetical protein FOQG_09209 [Fusarium oxysporum f. sp. raphani 54005]|uniref:Uncharacterized protein n=3 Tax=Fusarium oxysporum TaxID=5507 RepID=X0BZU5_FUSOX|nr:hypothetical protein FOVG_08710 [Fusarium oxysporum f. sp. pisi HDV247]EXK87406.1 hypothetical protein FOQG_09209 [Fusarium oxysporum f. sp. raphani 54005]EXL81191.1 hypothetical protein FOPG_05533 [Fusarium oxysporum f. sp. conglutinans race 2 54008]
MLVQLLVPLLHHQASGQTKLSGARLFKNKSLQSHHIISRCSGFKCLFKVAVRLCSFNYSSCIRYNKPSGDQIEVTVIGWNLITSLPRTYPSSEIITEYFRHPALQASAQPPRTWPGERRPRLRQVDASCWPRRT